MHRVARRVVSDLAASLDPSLPDTREKHNAAIDKFGSGSRTAADITEPSSQFPDAAT